MTRTRLDRLGEGGYNEIKAITQLLESSHSSANHAKQKDLAACYDVSIHLLLKFISFRTTPDESYLLYKKL